MFSLIPEHVGITLFEMGKNSLIFLISFSGENLEKILKTNIAMKYYLSILNLSKLYPLTNEMKRGFIAYIMIIL